jgi:hypothetical protein
VNLGNGVGTAGVTIEWSMGSTGNSAGMWPATFYGADAVPAASHPMAITDEFSTAISDVAYISGPSATAKQ